MNRKICKVIAFYIIVLFLFEYASGSVITNTVTQIIAGGVTTTFTYTYDTDTPAGSDAPSSIDDRIRETKDAVQERMNVDHYWPLTGSAVSDADAGEHRKVLFHAPIATTPTVAANHGDLRIADVDSVAELHWTDEDENELQLTSGGTINIVSADLLGTLANNTYFTAVDAAGTGTVDLIKADSNDVAVVPDNSQTATNAAPTMTKSIPNKKYVDDQIAANVGDSYRLVDVDGGSVKVYTKYLTGTLDNDTQTNVTHSITSGATKILAVNGSAYNDAGPGWHAPSMYSSVAASALNVHYDDTYVYFKEVGANFKGNSYKVRIDYIL